MAGSELKRKFGDGPSPPADYNSIVQAGKQMQNITVGGGLSSFRNPNGLHIALTNKIPELALTFTVQGQLITEANVAGKIRINKTITIYKIAAYIETISSSGSVVVDINISDTPDGAETSLYSVETKPTIVASGFEDLGSLPDTKVIEAGKYISIDVDSSGTGAKNLTIILYTK